MSQSYSKILQQSLVQYLLTLLLLFIQSLHVFQASQNQEVVWASELWYL